MGRELGEGSKVLLLPGVGTGRVQAGVGQWWGRVRYRQGMTEQ